MAAEDMPADEEEFRKFSQDEMEEMKTTFEAGNLEAVAKKLQEKLEMLDKIQLHIAVTGETGSGKSTFVNAIRGLGDEDEGAAKTGEVETTMQPEPYPHPTLPNVTLWDLPGIGTPRFKADEYLKQVSFQKYDFFIILTANRFTTHHTQLAQEIQKMKKRFYYVRSKVDADLYAAQKRRPSTYNEEGILQKIRNDCIENLEREAGEPSPRVFLISSWDLTRYDFPLLQQTLEDDLDVEKRHAFILVLPNISAQILEKKKAAFKREIWKLALLSGAISAVPVPGLSIIADIAILEVNMRRYCQAFGLDDAALCRLAQRVGKPVAELKSVIKAVPTASSINKEFVIRMLARSACLGVMIVEELLDLVPIAGPLLSGGVSFGSTFYMLKRFLNDAAEDAHRVLRKALS
ncbi:interferon-inducible GTPase 5-like [Alligator mississippiensis]|uniref:interferon-inducible GTPase 5-like n=1 Tax=Alligator mississippiensis TaxID=8496 RepID=UPI002877EDE3|nr:interferon-inducible GTPase 5-like [Alligator mississippiensis]